MNNGQSQGTVQCGNQEISYRIVRSGRRSLALQVKRDGQVIVRSPHKVESEVIHSFVRKHEAWILKHKSEIDRRMEQARERVWKDGMILWVHGEPRHLKIRNGDHSRTGKGRLASVRDTGSEIEVSLRDGGTEEAARAVISWYRDSARAMLEEKTALWAARMGIEYGTITVRNQTTRWGSCSAKGNLNFNWRLFAVPERAADYVVVHELAHIRQMNHSKQFWEIVACMMPDYEQQRRELRDYEDQMEINTQC